MFFLSQQKLSEKIFFETLVWNILNKSFIPLYQINIFCTQSALYVLQKIVGFEVPQRPIKLFYKWTINFFRFI